MDAVTLRVVRYRRSARAVMLSDSKSLGPGEYMQAAILMTCMWSELSGLDIALAVRAVTYWLDSDNIVL